MLISFELSLKHAKNHDRKKKFGLILISLKYCYIKNAEKRPFCHDKLIKRPGKDINNSGKLMTEVVRYSFFPK